MYGSCCNEVCRASAGWFTQPTLRCPVVTLAKSIVSMANFLSLSLRSTLASESPAEVQGFPCQRCYVTTC
jgi:hypothetical protein